jgi:CheY-like chemotaxis protein
MRSGTLVHLLLVDDDPSTRTPIARLLEREGYDVTTADDGLEALRLVGTRPFAVALVDLYMPNMDGLELIPKLKIQVPDIRVIATSGGYESGRGIDLLRAAERAGADGIIAKPFTIEELRETLVAVLE